MPRPVKHLILSSLLSSHLGIFFSSTTWQLPGGQNGASIRSLPQELKSMTEIKRGVDFGLMFIAWKKTNSCEPLWLMLSRPVCDEAKGLATVAPMSCRSFWTTEGCDSKRPFFVFLIFIFFTPGAIKPLVLSIIYSMYIYSFFILTEEDCCFPFKCYMSLYSKTYFLPLLPEKTNFMTSFGMKSKIRLISVCVQRH